MERSRPVLLWLSIVVLLFAAREDAAASRESAASANVGFTVLRCEIDDGRKEHWPLTVAVWYPTKEEERPDTYGNGTFSRFAYGAKAEAKSGPHALVIFSHGYGGSGIGSIFLCERLARHGFVVAAPDHSDDRAAMRIDGPTGTDLGEYLASAKELARSGKNFDRAAHAYRTRELPLTIDKILGENGEKGSVLEGAVNTNAIGAAGHSLGGYTVLASCGLVEGAKDDRIKAALVLSGGVFMFRADEFGRLEVPVMFMSGEREASRFWARAVNPKGDDTQRAYAACNPPKFLLEIRHANHFSFGQVVFSNNLLGSGPELGGKIASAIETYSLAFFGRYLLNDTQADPVLSRSCPMVKRCRFDVGQVSGGTAADGQ